MKEYRLMKADGTFCPTCGKDVHLLTAHFTQPAFYICFGCRFIGQVGVGPVKKLREDDGE